MDEIWKDIDGYNGKYQVSNLGRVRSIYAQYGKKRNEPKILKDANRGEGYRFVALTNNKQRKNINIHRLVAEAFVPNIENKPCVNHKDGDKANNHASNLEWVTYSENMQHASDNSLYKLNYGEDHHNSKLKERDVIKIRKLYEETDIYHRELAEMFGVTRTTIGEVIRKEIWAHV